MNKINQMPFICPAATLQLTLKGNVKTKLLMLFFRSEMRCVTFEFHSYSPFSSLLLAITKGGHRNSICVTHDDIKHSHAALSPDAKAHSKKDWEISGAGSNENDWTRQIDGY